MDNNNIRSHVESIIAGAVLRVAEAYKGETSRTRHCFPTYSKNDKKRVSEQEFRFAFVESFNEYVSKNIGLNDWYYAIEVPTADSYRFGDSKPKLEPRENVGRSAMFDLVIYKGSERICLIEFKSGNPEQSCYDKDYLKLMNPKEGNAAILRFFLQLVENHNNRKKNSIENKTINAINNAKEELIKAKLNGPVEVISRTYSLDNSKLNNPIYP